MIEEARAEIAMKEEASAKFKAKEEAWAKLATKEEVQQKLTMKEEAHAKLVKKVKGLSGTWDNSGRIVMGYLVASCVLVGRQNESFVCAARHIMVFKTMIHIPNQLAGVIMTE